MSTRGQQIKLHQLGRALEDDPKAAKQLVYGYIVQWYGEDPSTKALTTAQADDMIQRLQDLIQQDPQISNRQQRKKIYKLGYLLGWRSPAIRKFVKRQTQGRINDVELLTFQEASKVIRGMEKVLIDEGNAHLLNNKAGRTHGQ